MVGVAQLALFCFSGFFKPWALLKELLGNIFLIFSRVLKQIPAKGGAKNTFGGFGWDLLRFCWCFSEFLLGFSRFSPKKRYLKSLEGNMFPKIQLLAAAFEANRPILKIN